MKIYQRTKNNMICLIIIFLYTPPEPAAWWNLDHFETDHAMVAETGHPNNPYNGNPPSMFRLDDGRLGLTYAVRKVPGRLCAKISNDNGKTWGDEII